VLVLLLYSMHTLVLLARVFKSLFSKISSVIGIQPCDGIETPEASAGHTLPHTLEYHVRLVLDYELVLHSMHSVERVHILIII